MSLNYTDLARLTGAYGVSIRRYGEGAQQREDRWTLGTDILPGAILQGAAATASPVAIRLRAGREILYIRNYPDKVSALRALPKMPYDLPFDTDRALAMEPGDFASMPVYMGLALGLETGTSLPPFAVSAGTGIFWNGEFRYNVFRLDGNHVRLKVAPSDIRGWQVAASASAGLDMFGYGPFGLVNMDSQAERLLGFDFFRFSTTRVARGEKMAIDYVFDLGNPDAQLAFDAIMQKTVRLKADALGAQAVRGRVNQDQVFSDLTPAEFLNAADERLAPEQKRVARVFRGANLYQGATTDSRLGTRILRWESDKSLTLNWLKATIGEGSEYSFVHQLFTTGRKQSSWFSPLREHHRMTAGAVFSADARWERFRFEDLSFVWTMQDSDLNGSERGDIRTAVKAVLGDFYDHIGADAGLQAAPGQGFDATVRLGIHPDLLTTMAQTAARDPELYEKQIWHILWVITPRFEGRFGPRTAGGATDAFGYLRNFFSNSLQAIRKGMRSLISLRWEGIHGATATEIVERSLDIARTGEVEYLASLMRLLERDESAQEIVPAYLLTLAQAYRLSPYVEVTASGRGAEPARVVFGRDDGAQVQSLVRDAFYRINNLGYEQ